MMVMTGQLQVGPRAVLIGTVLIVMLGGAQLLCLGIIGEYLGRLYKEVKRRPLYHVEEDVGRVKWD